MKTAFLVAVSLGFSSVLLAGPTLAADNAPPQDNVRTVQDYAKSAEIGSETGYGIFQQHCMNCHGNPDVPKAPEVAALRAMSPEKIYTALTSGPMQVQGKDLSDLAKRRVAESVSGRLLGTSTSGEAKNMPNQCKSHPPITNPAKGPAWNGWSPTITNTRFQTAKAAGLTKADVPHLKLKWAFGYPDGISALVQPSISSGRVYVGTDGGYVYSIDAKTGCVYWSYKTKANLRGALTVAPIKGHPGVKYAVYFGDLHAYAYAIDADTGAEIWVTKVESEDYTARQTAALTYHNGVIYVPMSSWEEFSAKTLDYPCCQSRGTVSALDANTGKILWKTYDIPEAPKPVRKNSKGVQLYAPSGAAIWNTPTLDLKRSAVYFGTGDATTYPAADTSDSVMAVDMKTGKIRWHYQVTKNDSFLVGCGSNKTENCPKVQGPDWDIPCPPILTTLPNGKDVIIVGTKPGDVLALDPDKKGKVIWRVNVAEKGEQGIQWGGAVHDGYGYFGLTGGGMVKVRLSDGQKMWYTPFGKDVNNGAPTSAIPGVAFVPGSDGKLVAVSMDDGKILWSYDTTKDVDTVNKVKAHGGSIDTIGAAIADGMVVIGSGYNVVAGKPGNVLLAFSAE